MPGLEKIIVIGGGASGVLLAAHMLRQANARLDVTIIEKRGTVGRGVAYGTDEPRHLLNVRAINMSAFADDRPMAVICKRRSKGSQALVRPVRA